MASEHEITHLLKLLGDDSPVVRKEVLQALAKYGRGLAQELANFPGPPDERQRLMLQALLEDEDEPTGPASLPPMPKAGRHPQKAGRKSRKKTNRRAHGSGNR